MDKELEKIKQELQKDLERAKSLFDLESLRVKYLGRNSQLNKFLKGLKDFSDDERRKVGPMVSRAKKEIIETMAKLKQEFSAAGFESGRKIDVSRPAKKLPAGHIHLLTQVQEEVNGIFRSIGFEIVEGPEAETEFYNFDALNMPKDHPAREMQDTFWLRSNQISNFKFQISKNNEERLLLRTHTSPMQVRFMEAHQPPMRIIVPGRVYRKEATDQTHEFQFHQFEGLYVDRKVSLAHLKGILGYLFGKYFKEPMDVRFVSSYFPFVEPGVEVAIKGRKGVLADRWIEVAGAGMVHQNEFRAVGYSPREWTGFAFGMSVERLAMLKYKIDDIRLFNSGDLRFIKQF